MKFVRLLILLALPGLLLAKETKAKPGETAGGKAVTLDAYKFTDQAIGSFTIAIRTAREADSRKTRIFIIEVAAASDAEGSDLRVGDEIVKIGGVPVENMDPLVTKETELGKIFLNRKPGAPLELEVVTRRTKQVTLRAR
jgi:C-terminal processing protease CtpA/Prc